MTMTDDPQEQLGVAGPEDQEALEAARLSQEAIAKDLSLWRIRLALLRRAFNRNWALFKASRIGLVGIAVIGIFALMAILQPILVQGLTPFTAVVVVLLIISAFFFARSQVAKRFESNGARIGANVVGVLAGLSIGWLFFVLNGAWIPGIYDPVVGYDAPVISRTVVDEVVDPATEISFREALLTEPLVQLGDVLDIPAQPAPPSICAFTDRPDPCYSHYLGTDPLGRDIMSQLMSGARTAFLLGTVAALVTVFIATSVGSISAYYGGAIDAFFMRFADLILMLPGLAILVVMGAVLDFQLWHLGLLLGLLGGFGGTAIVLKSQALSVKVKPFIDAARVAGGSNRRIITTHLVPNVMPLSFLYMMFAVSSAIASEAILSFLGILNIDMSWGIMVLIASAQGYILTGAKFWWLIFPAGVAVTGLAAAFFLVGRAMDEVVNPRLRAR